MLFKVDRTSLYTDERPCNGAILRNMPRIDFRTFKTFEEYEKHFGESFLKKGTNHKILENGISREIMESVWTIEINSLEDMVEFVKKNGRIVFSKDEIEIYDNYRE